MRSKTRSTSQERTFIERARRRQIIEAAILSVARDGYAAASIAKVARRAGIGKGVVLYHFGKKDELMEAIVHHVCDEIWSYMRPKVFAEATARGRLRAYIESEFEFLAQHRPELVALSHIIMNHRDARGVPYLHLEAEKITVDGLANMLREGQESGEFRDFALRPMAATLMHALNGAVGQWAADPKVSLAEYSRELVTLFDLATRKRPGGVSARNT